MRKNHLFITHVSLLGMAALWGASWPWGRVVAQSMPPVAAACLRFLLAGAVLSLWMLRTGRWADVPRLNTRQRWGLLAASATGVFAYAICFLVALQNVPASKATVVVALNPGVTLLLAALLFREPLNWKIAFGMVIAITGALWAITGGDLAQANVAGQGMGTLLLMGCVSFWVAYTLIGRALLAQVDALTSTTLTALVGAVLLLITSLCVEGPAAWTGLAHTPWFAWLSLAGLAFGATALAYAWYLQGVLTLGAGAAASYLALVPLFGIGFSSLWLHEPLGLPLAAGGLLAITGMLITHIARERMLARAKLAAGSS